MGSSEAPPRFQSRFEHHGAGHVFALVEKMRLGWLLKHFPPLPVWALYVFVNGFMTIALLAILGVLTDTRLCFLRGAPLPIFSSSHHSELHLVRGTQF